MANPFTVGNQTESGNGQWPDFQAWNGSKWQVVVTSSELSAHMGANDKITKIEMIFYNVQGVTSKTFTDWRVRLGHTTKGKDDSTLSTTFANNFDVDSSTLCWFKSGASDHEIPTGVVNYWAKFDFDGAFGGQSRFTWNGTNNIVIQMSSDACQFHAINGNTSTGRDCIYSAGGSDADTTGTLRVDTAGTEFGFKIYFVAGATVHSLTGQSDAVFSTTANLKILPYNLIGQSDAVFSTSANLTRQNIQLAGQSDAAFSTTAKLTIVGDVEQLVSVSDYTTSTSVTDDESLGVSLDPDTHLIDGEKYMFLYTAQCGGDTTVQAFGCRVKYGSTLIGRIDCFGGTSPPGDFPFKGNPMIGYWVQTVNATDKLELFSVRASNTSSYTNKVLAALHLGSIVEDTDYFTGQQNGEAAEATSTDTAFSTGFSITKTLPGTEEYIVLASAELWADAATTAFEVRMVVDGVTRKAAVKNFTWTSSFLTTNRSSWSFAELITISSGSREFKIEFSRPSGTGTVSFRRGRIMVFRASTWDQAVQGYDVTHSVDITDEDVDNFKDALTQAYTPNQTEDVLAILSSDNVHHSSFRSALIRLRDDTGDVNYVYSSHQNQIAQAAQPCGVVAHLEGVSGAKTFKAQVSQEDPSTISAVFRDTTLILWSMTKATVVPTDPDRVVSLLLESLF